MAASGTTRARVAAGDLDGAAAKLREADALAREAHAVQRELQGSREAGVAMGVAAAEAAAELQSVEEQALLTDAVRRELQVRNSDAGTLYVCSRP